MHIQMLVVTCYNESPIDALSMKRDMELAKKFGNDPESMRRTKPGRSFMQALAFLFGEEDFSLMSFLDPVDRRPEMNFRNIINASLNCTKKNSQGSGSRYQLCDEELIKRKAKKVD